MYALCVKVTNCHRQFGLVISCAVSSFSSFTKRQDQTNLSTIEIVVNFHPERDVSIDFEKTENEVLKSTEMC